MSASESAASVSGITTEESEESGILTQHEGPSERSRQIEELQTRNLLVLALHQIVMRTSWIFKTESVIMPAFVDAIAGAAWVRGWLPVLNRFGQSVPPLLFAERLQYAPLKKRLLIATTWIMAVPFLTLSAIWLTLQATDADLDRLFWLPPLFLFLYTVFFSTTGLNLLSFNTLQGKLIHATRRGRLMTLTGVIGSLTAITCAWLVLRTWLERKGGGFGLIFGTTGLGFLVAGAVVFWVAEPVDQLERPPRRPFWDHFRIGWQTLKDDRNFRWLAATVMLFITTMLLFPHYQAMGRELLNCNHSELLAWLIAQNAGAGLFSVFAGTLADRYGNRLAMRFMMTGTVATPLMALAIAHGIIPGGRSVYWITFVFLGLTPMAIRTIANYTLELCDEMHHAKYLSTLKICMGVPILFAPLVGVLIDHTGFTPAFLGVSVILFCSVLLTFRLPEPRNGVNV